MSCLAVDRMYRRLEVIHGNPQSDGIPGDVCKAVRCLRLVDFQHLISLVASRQLWLDDVELMSCPCRAAGLSHDRHPDSMHVWVESAD